MKSLLFFFVFFAFNSITVFGQITTQGDSIQLNKNAIINLKSKVQRINFLTCDEKIILGYNNDHFDKTDFENENEFEKKQFLKMVRDTLNLYQNKFSLNDIYGYTSTRLLGEYDFEKNFFPIVGNYYMNGGRFPISSYKNENQVILEHTSMGLNLVNEDKFPLKLKLDESEAKNLIETLKKMRREYLDSLYSPMDERTKIFYQHKGIKFRDDYGNYAENEDRRIYFRYFIKVIDPSENTPTKKKAVKFINSIVNPSGKQIVEEDPNSLKVQIVKLEMYLKGGVPSKVVRVMDIYPE